MIYTKKSV